MTSILLSPSTQPGAPDSAPAVLLWPVPGLDELGLRTLAATRTKNTFRSYKQALRDYARWRNENGQPPLCRTTVHAYVQSLIARNLGHGSINLYLSAIKAMAREAAAAGIMPATEAAAIETIRSIPVRNQRSGAWLTAEQAQALLNTPDPTTLWGLRDRAVIAMFLGAALRREELVRLTVDQLQQVATSSGQRWALVNVTRKHGRVQTIPIPDWTYQAITAWLTAANITEGRILRGLAHRRTITESMSTVTAWSIVKDNASQIGLRLAPHDLRRTAATLELFAGADIRKIQQQLGHASVQTTERYLQTAAEMENPACDVLKFEVR